MGDDLLVKDGCMRPIKPMNGRHYTLTELQTYVGGYVQTLKVGNGKLLVIDEEGKLKGKLPNRIATGWILREGYQDFIVGTALLIDAEHIQ